MTTKKSHGPVIWQSDPADPETLSIRCMAGNIVCGFCNGMAACTAVQPPQRIPDVKDTPEWCPLRDQAEADMQEIKGAAA